MLWSFSASQITDALLFLRPLQRKAMLQTQHLQTIAARTVRTGEACSLTASGTDHLSPSTGMGFAKPLAKVETEPAGQEGTFSTNPKDYAPFKAGPFKVTMGLSKMDPEEWVEIDDLYEEELQLRRELLRDRRDIVLRQEPEVRPKAAWTYPPNTPSGKP